MLVNSWPTFVSHTTTFCWTTVYGGDAADSADDDDVAAAVIRCLIARRPKRKHRRPKSVWVQSWIMQR